MKKYIKNLIVPAIFMSSLTAFAQDKIDGDTVVRENEAEYSVVAMITEDNEKIIAETEAVYPVVFDDSERYELNQTRIVVPPRYETTYKLDADRDNDFEREITVSYTRPENRDFNFMMTDEGLKVWMKNDEMYSKEIHMMDKDNNRKKVSMLSNKGKYMVVMSNDEEYEIEVIDMK